MSKDENFLVVHNLLTGFDRYDLRTGDVISSYEISFDVTRNILLPVLYIHDDADILIGDARGDVRILDVESRIVQRLPHESRLFYFLEACRRILITCCRCINHTSHST